MKAELDVKFSVNDKNDSTLIVWRSNKQRVGQFYDHLSLLRQEFVVHLRQKFSEKGLRVKIATSVYLNGTRSYQGNELKIVSPELMINERDFIERGVDWLSSFLRKSVHEAVPNQVPYFSSISLQFSPRYSMFTFNFISTNFTR